LEKDIDVEEPPDEPYVDGEVRYKEEEAVDSPEVEEEPKWTDADDESVGEEESDLEENQGM
jgi:hypothetical protein